MIHRPHVRRRAGVIMLMFTLLVGLAFSAIARSSVPGRPLAAPLPPAPTVGDCVLDDPRTHRPGAGELTQVRYGDCSVGHFGEVVFVYADSGALPRADIDGISYAQTDVCATPAAVYLGAESLVAGTTGGSGRFGSWRPAGTGSVLVTGPDSRQQLAGQHWAACVTVGIDEGAYPGTARAAFTGGRLPTNFSRCDGFGPATGHAVSCASPHGAEIFAETGLSHELPGAGDLLATCTRLLSTLTGMADPTAGGVLLVDMTSAVYDSSGVAHTGAPDSGDGQPAQATCGLRTIGTHVLIDSLFGVGSGPLPLR